MWISESVAFRYALEYGVDVASRLARILDTASIFCGVSTLKHHSGQ